MNDEKFQALDSLAEDLAGFFESLDRAGQIEPFRKQLQQILNALPDRYSAAFNLSLTVFDAEREKKVDIFEIGVACNGGDRPYNVSAGNSFNRYLSNGAIVEIPHSYCPSCWAEWDFKTKGESCPECGAMFGREIKLLLDSEICPNCLKGSVSQSHPHCSSCDFEADPELIVWG